MSLQIILFGWFIESYDKFRNTIYTAKIFWELWRCGLLLHEWSYSSRRAGVAPFVCGQLHFPICGGIICVFNARRRYYLDSLLCKLFAINLKLLQATGDAAARYWKRLCMSNQCRWDIC